MGVRSQLSWFVKGGASTHATLKSLTTDLQALQQKVAAMEAQVLSLSKELPLLRDRQLDEFDPRTSGAWPHAAATLIRQSLESTADVFWQQKAPGMLETSRTDRWVCMPAFLGDRPQARDADFAWTALSQACHHRAYDVGLTQDELRTHLATARNFLTTIAQALA